MMSHKVVQNQLMSSVRRPFGITHQNVATKPGNDPTGSEKSKEEKVSLVERTGIFDVAKHYAT